jgi:hypothetical protein
MELVPWRMFSMGPAMGSFRSTNRLIGGERRWTRWPGIVAQIFLAGLLCALITGCGAPPPAFEFDVLDAAPNVEELSEISLGEYRIPIPVVEHRADIQPFRNRFQLDFELFALASPQEDAQIRAAWHRHRGKIRDRVIRVCRCATIDELRETELGTLKARLMDALCQQLGNKDLRQLLIAEIVSQDI